MVKKNSNQYIVLMKNDIFCDDIFVKVIILDQNKNLSTSLDFLDLC